MSHLGSHVLRRLTGRSAFTASTSVRVRLALIAAPCLAALPLSGVQAATPAMSYCSPTDTRTYTQTSAAWYASDSGTLRNGSAGTITKSFTHTANRSLTSTVSAEVGAKVSIVVSEINAKLGVSVSVTAAYTTSTTFTVTAPAHTTVSYRDGILKRAYSVKRVRRDDNCVIKTTYGTATMADNYSVAS